MSKEANIKQGTALGVAIKEVLENETREVQVSALAVAFALLTRPPTGDIATRNWMIDRFCHHVIAIATGKDPDIQQMGALAP